MEEEQVIENPKGSFPKKLLFIVLLVGCALLFLYLGYSTGYDEGYRKAVLLYGEPKYETKTESDKVDPYTHEPDSRSGEVLMSTTSPGGSYIFRVLDSGPGSSRCEYDVTNRGGTDQEIGELVDKDTLDCEMGMFGWVVPEYEGWSGDSKIMFSHQDRFEAELRVVDLENKVVDVFEHDPSEMSTSEKRNGAEGYILFSTMDDPIKSSYSLLTNEPPFEEVKGFTLESSDSDTTVEIYDKVNEMNIFITREFNFVEKENEESYDLVDLNVYGLKASDLSLTKLIPTHQYRVYGGRGCGPAEAKSTEPGVVVIYTGSCFEIPEEYLVGGGYMRIPLN